MHRQIPDIIEVLKNETKGKQQAQHQPACTARDPAPDLPETAEPHVSLPQTASDSAVRAQALMTQPDIVWMGVNTAQEESLKKEGRVRPKGSTSYTILQSVRATHNDDNRLHVS